MSVRDVPIFFVLKPGKVLLLASSFCIFAYGKVVFNVVEHKFNVAEHMFNDVEYKFSNAEHNFF